MDEGQLQVRVDQDLIAKVEGEFSPSEMHEISRIAGAKWRQENERLNDGDAAWNRVTQDFFSQNFWGFQPRVRKILASQEDNLGVKFILLSFVTATFGLMAVVWLGQNYSSSGSTEDLLLLFLAIGTIAAMYIGFLIKHRRPNE